MATREHTYLSNYYIKKKKKLLARSYFICLDL